MIWVQLRNHCNVAAFLLSESHSLTFRCWSKICVHFQGQLFPIACFVSDDYLVIQFILKTKLQIIRGLIQQFLCYRVEIKTMSSNIQFSKAVKNTFKLIQDCKLPGHRKLRKGIRAASVSTVTNNNKQLSQSNQNTRYSLMPYEQSCLRYFRMVYPIIQVSCNCKLSHLADKLRSSDTYLKVDYNGTQKTNVYRPLPVDNWRRQLIGNPTCADGNGKLR